MLKAAEKTLLDVFFSGLENANTRFNYTSFVFVEDVFTKMETRRSLVDIFERNL